MVDYQAKYESLLRSVLSDLNSEVLTAQGRAEKNAEGEKSRLFTTPFDALFLHASQLVASTAVS